MTMMRSIIRNLVPFAVLIGLCSLWPVQALPTGAAGCPANTAAVSGAHLESSKNITTGSLADGGFEITIGDTIKLGLGDATSADFAVGLDHAVTLDATNPDKLIRGFLFRLGGEGTTEALQPGTDLNVQLAETVCIDNEGVGGVTHKDALDKKFAWFVLSMDNVTANLPLDVTVVVSNQGSVSEYYYSQFILNAVEGTAPTDVDAGDGDTPSVSTSAGIASMMLGGTTTFVLACVSSFLFVL